MLIEQAPNFKRNILCHKNKTKFLNLKDSNKNYKKKFIGKLTQKQLSEWNNKSYPKNYGKNRLKESKNLIVSTFKLVYGFQKLFTKGSNRSERPALTNKEYDER